MKLNKKLTASIAALVMTVALAATSTFAWFTMNQNVTITGIDGTVTSEYGGLYIVTTAVDAGYTDGVDIFEASKAMPTQTGLTMEDLTENTQFADAANRQTNVDDWDLVDQGGTVATYNATEKQYIAFDIHFRADRMGAVNFQNLAVTGTPRADLNTKAWADLGAGVYTAGAITANTVLEANASNAVRVAFIDKTDADVITGVKVWEPNSDEGYSAVRGTGPARNMAQDFEARFKNQDLVTVTPKVPNPADVEDADINSTSAVTLAAKGSYYEARLTVYVWIEGHDEDALNSITGEDIAFALAFGYTPA